MHSPQPKAAKAASLGFVIPGMRVEYGLGFSAVAVLPFVALLGTSLGSFIWGSAGRYLWSPRRDFACRRFLRRYFHLRRHAVFLVEYRDVFFDGACCRRHAAGRERSSCRNSSDQTPGLVPGAAWRHWDGRRLLRHQRMLRATATVFRVADHVVSGISNRPASHCTQSVSSRIHAFPASNGTNRRCEKDAGALRFCDGHRIRKGHARKPRATRDYRKPAIQFVVGRASSARAECCTHARGAGLGIRQFWRAVVVAGQLDGLGPQRGHDQRSYRAFYADCSSSHCDDDLSLHSLEHQTDADSCDRDHYSGFDRHVVS